MPDTNGRIDLTARTAGVGRSRMAARMTIAGTIAAWMIKRGALEKYNIGLRVVGHLGPPPGDAPATAVGPSWSPGDGAS